MTRDHRELPLAILTVSTLAKSGMFAEASAIDDRNGLLGRLCEFGHRRCRGREVRLGRTASIHEMGRRRTCTSRRLRASRTATLARRHGSPQLSFFTNCPPCTDTHNELKPCQALRREGWRQRPSPRLELPNGPYGIRTVLPVLLRSDFSGVSSIVWPYGELKIMGNR